MVKGNHLDGEVAVLDERDVVILGKEVYALPRPKWEVKKNTGLPPAEKGKVVMLSWPKYPQVHVSHTQMSPWRIRLKKCIDVTGALGGLLVSLPLSVVLMSAIKLSSRGPVFYSHERIGQFGKPFLIYKFRSMYAGAEPNGPQLASENDPRITPLGRFMRRFKLDEIPNLYNVLRGDMSLVGPRPERKFYIDLIIERSPEYLRLLNVKPGVTSWGQVKYGYAKDVEEMLHRMNFDLLYIKDMSLFVDFKILTRTLFTVVRGNRK
ncbi:MAG: sugar transferase [Bacteroidota bacterium]|nr:sugar transferase [Bacteroidota bacterium]